MKTSSGHFSSMTVWICVACFYLYENMLTTILGAIPEEIMQQFSIHHAELGWMASAFFLAYACMQIPVGWLLDRYSVRSCLLYAVFICALSVLIFAGSSSFEMAFFARMIMGACSAFAPLGAFAITAQCFPSERFALMIGLLLTFGGIGGMIGHLPALALVNTLGLFSALCMMSVLGFMICLMLWFVLPLNQEKTNQMLPSFSFLRNLNLWLIMVYAALMYAPYLVLQSVWGKPFLQEILNVSSESASMLLTFLMLGFLLGSPILGALSDFLYPKISRKTSLMSAALGTLLLTIGLLTPSFQNVKTMQFLLMMWGFSCSGFLISFTLLKTLVPASSRSLALGVMNTVNTLGGVALPPLLGSCIHHHHQIQHHAPYASSFNILTWIFIFALLMSLFIQEKPVESQ